MFIKADGASSPEDPEPFRLTTSRWTNKNRRRRELDGSTYQEYAKVIARKGPYEQYEYGLDYPSDWSGPLQEAIICCPSSRAIAVDVDFERWYLETRTAQFIRREHAISTRTEPSGVVRWHALIDARSVPPDLWPGQKAIHGADIKSNGFIPVPGCWHYSGGRYEPAPAWHRGLVMRATPELIAAIRADQEGRIRAGGNGHGGGGTGGGHDGQVAAAVMSMIARGMTKEQCWQEFQRIAVPHDPADPFTREDFERHYGDQNRGALRKIRERDAQNQAVYESFMRAGVLVP